jgi:hypothetical protein
MIDQRQQKAGGDAEQRQQTHEMTGARVDRFCDPGRQDTQRQLTQLLGEPAVRLAHVAAARFERAAQ